MSNNVTITIYRSNASSWPDDGTGVLTFSTRSAETLKRTIWISTCDVQTNEYIYVHIWVKYVFCVLKYAVRPPNSIKSVAMNNWKLITTNTIINLRNYLINQVSTIVFRIIYRFIQINFSYMADGSHVQVCDEQIIYCLYFIWMSFSFFFPPIDVLLFSF